ncbi:MAG: hypothetical protein HY801_09950 [Candidatus Lindowbacteria bacterium]|nr:hypothetical protein [Candidatus Lindowbacteria bacterium]
MDKTMPMQKLLDVQKVDLRIKGLEMEVSVIPHQIREWDSALNLQKAQLAANKKEVEEKKKSQRQLEREIEQKQSELAKFNAQLPQIKTNREYKAILVEIDMVEKQISDLEEQVLVRMTEIEELEGKIKVTVAEVEKAEEEINKEKEQLKKRKKALEESLEGTRSERKTLVTAVDGSLLSQYDRIRTRKGGLAVARVLDESCGACHMELPPQVVNEVIGGRIKACPSCSRLLYWEEVSTTE